MRLRLILAWAVVVSGASLGGLRTAALAAEDAPEPGASPTLVSLEAANRDPRMAAEVVKFVLAQDVTLARLFKAQGRESEAVETLNDALVFLAGFDSIPTVDADRIGAAIRAESEVGRPCPPDQSAGFDVIRGHVLRAKGTHAEVDVNLSHGLHNWQRGNLIRSGKIIDRFAIVLIDSTQAAGFTDWETCPQPGDEVVFYRRSPTCEADHPANRLIGKRAELDLTFLPPGRYSRYTLRIYDVQVDAFGGIVSVVAGNDSLMPHLQAYRAEHIKSLTTDADRLVLDEWTRELIAPDLLATRNGWRSELILAHRKAEAEAAERRRLEEEAARLRREAHERAVAARKKLVEEYARNHLIPGKDEQSWLPAPGYEFVEPANPKNLAVRWTPGLKHPGWPPRLAARTEGEWESIEYHGDSFVSSRDGVSRSVNTLYRPRNQARSGYWGVRAPSTSNWSIDRETAVTAGMVVAAGMFMWALGNASSDGYSGAASSYGMSEEAYSERYRAIREENAARRLGQFGP